MLEYKIREIICENNNILFDEKWISEKEYEEIKDRITLLETKQIERKNYGNRKQFRTRR